jgi:DNA mismatch endonuclease (patch repair protein)
MDKLSISERSSLMAKVRSGDTQPEHRVRRVAHALGLRFRLHRRDLPGKPDIVFPKYRVAIFVHGCFWHRHPGCKRASMPQSRIEFWRNKLKRNVQRDLVAVAALEASGWRTEVIWECETKDSVQIGQRLKLIFFSNRKKSNRRV